MRYCRVLIIGFTLLVSIKGNAQDGIGISPTTKSREDIDKIQKLLYTELELDDTYHQPPHKLKDQLNNALLNKVDDLQAQIETDSLLDVEKKISFLTGLNAVLISFQLAFRNKEFNVDKFPPLISAYSNAVNIGRSATSIISALQDIDYMTAQIIFNSYPYQNNHDLNIDKELYIRHVYHKQPANIFQVLYAFPGVGITDSLLPPLARTHPEELYTYSQAKFSELGKKIHASKDTLVQLIASLAEKKEGQLYFPFTGSLICGEITPNDISRNFGKKNKVNYFKLLVKTQIRYIERLTKGDTAIASNVLLDKIKKNALEDFVNVINGLHDRPDVERLKVIESLSPPELYYLCIAGADELYTSSYLKIYHRIFKTSKYPDSYSLLQMVHFDHFKRFIKLASNFNTLSDFLNRMNKVNADTLMKSFVNGLQNTNSLEEAVDVADSYASIKDPHLKKIIVTGVRNNLSLLKKYDNKTGIVIYGLLNNLFTSLDSITGMDISSKFNIPSIYHVDIETLKDQSGKIIIQEYFYGDLDGNIEFNNFLKKYRNNQWEVINKKAWVELHAKDKSNIVIYANKPLDDITYKDIKAQEELVRYLSHNNLVPKIVIHRGHSYFVKYTIRHLTASVKIVLLGSCGGYNNLEQVIKASPYVHIIASKQEGNGSINQPMIFYLTKLLTEGKNLYWPSIWKEFEIIFKNNKKFDDYIPPYKNLGAIFMMVFNKQMESKD